MSMLVTYLWQQLIALKSRRIEEGKIALQKNFLEKAKKG